jgi:HlyD family secretion protein
MEAVVIVQDTENLKATASLGKYDANKVKIGQEVIIKNGNKSYKGIISFIDPAANKTVGVTGSETTLAVEISILDKSPDLKIDFDVDVDILIGQVFNVVRIPAEAIMLEKDNKNLAYVVDGNIAHERTLVLGLRSDTNVEVKDGIKPGETVILNPTTEIIEGVHVKGDNNAGGK